MICGMSFLFLSADGIQFKIDFFLKWKRRKIVHISLQIIQNMYDLYTLISKSICILFQLFLLPVFA